MRTAEEIVSRRRIRTGAVVLLAGIALFVWARARAQRAADPAAALDALRSALSRGDMGSVAWSRSLFVAAARRAPLSADGMRRLAALDLLLQSRPSCQEGRVGTSQVACRLLAGELNEAVIDAGEHPVGADALLKSLAVELLARQGQVPPSKVSFHPSQARGSPNAR